MRALDEGGDNLSFLGINKFRTQKTAVNTVLRPIEIGKAQVT
jgi:hypothetical protein